MSKERKWTRFPEKEIRCYNNSGITIGDYFEIKRGLATGDNSFFIMSKKKINDLGLDMSFFKPVLPSPRYLKTDLVESDDGGIPLIEPQCFLLDCKLTEQEIMEQSPTIWEYLHSGIEKTSQKYLCKNRKNGTGKSIGAQLIFCVPIWAEENITNLQFALFLICLKQ